MVLVVIIVILDGHGDNKDGPDVDNVDIFY